MAVAAVTALFGLHSYRSQKKVNREEELWKERVKAYSAYLSAYAETERWKGVDGKEKEFGEALLKYSQADSALFNVVVDDVIRRRHYTHVSLS